MLEILRKIIVTGTVTEGWDQTPAAPGFRGEVLAQEERCRQCAQCVRACPVDAIILKDGQISIDQGACIFCGRCVEVCEAGALAQSGNDRLATLSGVLQEKSAEVLGRSLALRHVDAGSCNACDWEMTALSNPVYDLAQYGIQFVASPRHADLLMVTGTVTRNLTQALRMTYEATPEPKLVMAVGSCACRGRTFGESYAIRGGVDALVPVDIYVPGCPPRPQALLYGLLLALDRL
ncbi:nadh ubiquinone oxidoreductase 20 kd subunit [Lucifera butyrica]|uniref:Nadh ubiquinone oxidoreductase 20 kd subunit n=1 Tax=Lucifera butyrica TaxID=1351585 RepID=A0A498R5P4_9FIRM|nr:NADH-quinone oxidoreductase subunit NuoB [Lucifera butyrica]VBB06774.1 nadh ubiquinone oxidoreductase 20 kd subunit [Lucifera butyrica]